MASKYRLTIPLLLLISYDLRLENIIVKNSRSQNLEFAYVLNLSNNNWSISDHNGIAPLPYNTKVNDILKIQRYGYKTTKLIFVDTLRIAILDIEPVVFKNIDVKSSGSLSAYDETSISKQSRNTNISHKNFLELLPGVKIRTLGGPGSISTVSINGGPTSQTKVTLNGFDITNTQTGVTDLSQLPNALIDQARIITSGHKLMQSGSQNGVLELNTWRPENSFSISNNSINSRNIYGIFQFQSKLINASIISGNRHDLGDFQVKWRDEVFRRDNNYFDQKYGSLQINGRINDKLFFKSLNLITKQRRGVPGQVWSPMDANHVDDLNIYAASLNWISASGKGSLKYFYRTTENEYNNPSYSIYNKNKLLTSSLSISNPIIKTRNSLLDLSLKTESQKLKSDDNAHIRSTFSSVFKYTHNYSGNIIFQPSVQNIYSPKLSNQSTYTLLGTYRFVNQIFDQLSVSLSSHFRHPTFNDLFWKPGGNPDLKPENGRNHSVGLSSKKSRFGTFKFLYFKSKTENLIQWLPVQSYWQAKNLSNTKRYGLSGNWNKYTKSIQAQFSFSLIESYFGDKKKPLRYSPGKIATVDLVKRFKNWIISMNTNYTGEMISMYSYPKDNIIPASTITSFHASKRYNVKYIDITIGTSIINIFNSEYESSKGYPEPGRSIELNLTLNQKGR